MALPTKHVGQTYTAAEMLALYQQAEADILAGGQSKAIRGKTLTHANLGDIRKGIEYWQKRAGTSGGIAVVNARHGTR